MDCERRLHQRTYGGVGTNAKHLVVHERTTRLVGVSPEDGTTLWEHAGFEHPGGVTVIGERCLVQAQCQSRQVCLDARSGERLWGAPGPHLTGHLVVVDEDTVIVGGERRAALRAVDTATGGVRWTRADLVRHLRPAVSAAGVLVGAPDGRSVLLVDVRDGQDLAEWPLPEPIAGPGHVARITVVDADRVVVRCGTSSVVEIVPSTGGVREIIRAERSLSDTPPVVAGGVSWLRKEHTGLVVVGSDGEVRETGVRQEVVNQVIPFDGGFVVAGKAGSLIRLDGGGRRVARAVVAHRIRAIHPFGAERVLVATKGTLRAISLSSVPWVTRTR
ncbi:PQQ-binding-like beta-propeller repeat protein [Actinokineospora globicatena]|uniref:Pyrrolo-quinoline quinone repeat domain-containing protein n=1 Tax=Actinokineospora globicatena TaxID=103729 RepID=A0A9W6QLN6_9PSEU|nr:PQQ-binding-like beta-propeller repeat protein [Actinokineospora globicatena]GLW90789.1 hypothetical protein Aglo03_16050 [Actinokineospora globicatena]